MPPVATVYHFITVLGAGTKSATVLAVVNVCAVAVGAEGIIIPVTIGEPANKLEVAPVNAKFCKVPLAPPETALVNEVIVVFEAASIP